ncbi:MAG: phenylacetate--CoA ligase [Syntrophobacterales bacterium CG03_land_8_20_14_0_80_58_14]|nr:MAG: phenylacetate--CoA ligase [Syntrophaceae bacterium CG2_30_58_14]PIV00738.1 MAG: phenylacetate--CoA ligase [Syntrophobacterales bacterium CG03_land_8_20_14_0_80_58_14]
MKHWSKEESLSRKGMKKLQGERLAKVCERAYASVPFYKKVFDKAKIRPAQIKSIDDIVRLPFTTKLDLRDNYPFGMFAVPMKDIVRIHASSGTTGQPTAVGYTRYDLEIWAEAMARTMTAAGTTANDIVQNAYGYGLFTGGLGAHYGAEKIGAAVIPISGGNTQKQIMLMKDFGTTVLCSTPSFCLYIYDVMKQEKINPQSLKLKIGIFGAEPWTDAMRKEIEKRMHIKAIDIFGLSEITGPGVSFECAEAQNGLHVNEDFFYPEIIDPDTAEVLPFGEEGELVLTTLLKEGIPLIRYRVKDITSLNPEKCICGRTLVRMSRVRGRSDDMLIIRGVNVFPSQVESVLLKSKAVAPHYMIFVDRKGRMDEMAVHVEVTTAFIKSFTQKVLSDDLTNFIGEFEEMKKLKKEIKERIKDVIGVTTDIKLVPPNTIARSEGKAKRVTDNRPR